MNPSRDAQHLTRIAAGDAGALAPFIDVFGPKVWALALRLSPTREDAEAATQEIFLEIWRRAAQFDGQRAPQSVFVMIIARRRLVDRLRLRSPAPIVVPLEAAGGHAWPDRVSATEPFARLLGDASEASREALEAAWLRGRSHREIADELGIPLGTVKALLRRTLLDVRHRLAQHAAPDGRSGTPTRRHQAPAVP